MLSRSLCSMLLLLSVAAARAQESSPAVQAGSMYGRLGTTFEANWGQTDPQVKFVSRSKGYTAFLTVGGIALSLRPTQVTSITAGQNNNPPRRQQSSNAILQFKFVGGAANPVIVGEDPQSGRVNYFIGNDKSRWRTNVPTYGKVRYKNIYPGIDLIYYGNHRQLEYDFEIQAGADLRQIQFEVTGADQLQLDAEGNLLLTLGTQQLRLRSPSVYQQSNGRRVAINGSYALIDSKHVVFQVPEYDPNKLLVIDPVLVYSTYLGGSDDEAITGLAVDSAGSVYVAGYTDSVDFPVTSLGSLASGNDHAFLAKLDPTGSHLVYADYIGGNSPDYGYALTLDPQNEVYLTGSTSSSDFPVVNAYQATYPGSFNAFFTKISADGASLLYSTYLGGSGSDVPSAIAIDASADIYVAGSTSSTNFPVVNAYQPTVSPNQGGNYGVYGFVTKFVPDGSSLAYSTFIGGSTNVVLNCGGQPCWGSPESQILGLALDTSGNAYLAGNTNTYNFPTTTSAYQNTNSAPNNSLIGFVTKLSSSGSLDYSTYFYESSGFFTNLTAIAVDGAGSAYVTGMAASDGTFPVTSTTICDPSITSQTCDFAFVSKFNGTASSLIYSTFLGPNNYAYPAAIVLDHNNDAYVLATTSSTTFSAVNSMESYSGGSDLLLTEIDTVAGSELFATFLGGTADELAAAAMAMDANGNIYLAGTTTSTDIPTTPGAFETQPGGSSDGFVMKIGAANAPAVSLNPYSLQYSPIPTGSTSQAQQVLLRNMGSAALSITSIMASQEFAETDNCAPSVPAAGTCTLSVTFTPTLVGQRQGSVSINDNAAGSPHTVPLIGTGTGNQVGVTPATLTFPSTPLKTAAPVQTVTLNNQDVAGLPITSIQVNGDYTQTNNCPATLASGSSCTISVTFTPTATGNRSGTLTIADGATGSPQSVALSGSGADFTLTSSVTTNTITAGASATYTLTLASVGGAFNNAIALSCSGAPTNSTCNLSPASATPGTGSATITVTVSTKASTSEAASAIRSSKGQMAVAFWMQLPGFGVVGLFISGSKSRRKTITVVALVLVVAFLVLLSGCAGGTGIAPQGNSGTPSGTYTITVTGSYGSLQHSLPLSLTVK